MSESGITAGSSFSTNREEKVLRNFKQILNDLLVVLRISANSDTAYMYWVNRKREQFVLESGSTDRNDVHFHDRVVFDELFLEPYKDLDKPTLVELSESFPANSLSHHTNASHVRGILLLPLINKNETVAITGLELDTTVAITEKVERAASSYLDAMKNILRTYLELSGMLEDEHKWHHFDEAINNLAEQRSTLKLCTTAMEVMLNQLESGGVALISKTMDSWHIVASAAKNSKNLPVGLLMSENSQVGLSIKSLNPEFSLHYNGNPKRVNPQESYFEGASIVVPISNKKFRQGAFLVWDENALLFKDSLKHKLITVGSICSLALESILPGKGDELADIFSETNKTCKIELLEHVIDSEIKSRLSGNLPTSMYLAFVTPADYQDIRSNMRLNETKQLQEAMSVDLNPNHSRIPGLVGLHTECIFMVLMNNVTEQQVMNWTQNYSAYVSELNEESAYPDGIYFHFGIIELQNKHEDSFHYIQDAKKALNQAVKQKLEIVI